MNILYIITQADGGGAQKYVLALAKYFEGSIAAGSEDSKLFEASADLHITAYNLHHLKRAIHPWHDFMAIWEIRQLVKSLEPDIVHLNSTKAGILGSFACIGLKTKVVFTAHGFRFNEPLSHFSKTFYLALEKVASSYRDFIISVSDADRQSALNNKLIGTNKIKTIHNGLPPINFLPRDEARQKLSLPMDKKIIVTVANDYKTKGLDVLEKAISLASGDYLTVVIGKVAPNKKSTVRIKYLGFMENAAQYLKAFNAVIIPSRKEGFPFAALEAMQAGLPILSTNVGGLPEALGDAALLVRPEDAQTLAEAIEKILANENTATELSKKALERSKAFSEQKMLEETKKIYEKLLN